MNPTIFQVFEERYRGKDSPSSFRARCEVLEIDISLSLRDSNTLSVAEDLGRRVGKCLAEKVYTSTEGGERIVYPACGFSFQGPYDILTENLAGEVRCTVLTGIGDQTTRNRFMDGFKTMYQEQQARNRSR